MTQHTVTSFDDDLDALDRMVITMGQAVLRQLQDAAALLESWDAGEASRIVAADRAIDDMQTAIEEAAVKMIARRQPLAVDLRTVIAILKIATDLERSGDLVKNNAKRVVALSGRPMGVAGRKGLEALYERVEEQLKEVLSAFQRRDGDLAIKIWREDAEVDALQIALFRELLTYMMEDPRNIGVCTQLLFTARNLERIGDHATNIAEHVHYIVKGRSIPGERPKGDAPGSMPGDPPG